MVQFFLLLSLVMIVGVSDCMAKDITTFNLSPTVGSYFFADSQRLETAPVTGIRFAYDIIGPTAGSSIGIEGGFSYIPTHSTRDDRSVGVYLLRLDALYPFWPRNRIVPFIAAGVGGRFVDGGNSGQDPLINYGGGVKYYLTDVIALRGDARHIIVFDDDRHSEYEITAGLSFTLFGGDKSLRRVPLADTDRDGVPDALDLCPGTPRGILVDKNGCPVDSDGDGVPDSLDKCPRTTRGVKVDARGCPEPTLGPAKPAEPAGEEPGPAPGPPEPPAKAPEDSAGGSVPVEGAPLRAGEAGVAAGMETEKAAGGAVVVTGPETGMANPTPGLLVEFDFNSAAIRTPYREDTRGLARFMAANSTARIVVAGHTDGRGASDYNLGLSRRRAESVRSLLVDGYGIPAARIRIEYFGLTDPVASNTTIEGRQKNRRVSVVIEGGNASGKSLKKSDQAQIR